MNYLFFAHENDGLVRFRSLDDCLAGVGIVGFDVSIVTGKVNIQHE